MILSRVVTKISSCYGQITQEGLRGGGNQTASSRGFFWFYFSSFFLWTYRGATFIVAGEIPGPLLLMTALLLVSRKLSTLLCLNCSLSRRDSSLWLLRFYYWTQWWMNSDHGSRDYPNGLHQYGFQQCFGSKCTNHKQGSWYTNH